MGRNDIKWLARMLLGAFGMGVMVGVAPAAAADLGGDDDYVSFKDAPRALPWQYYVGFRGGLSFQEDTDFDTLGLNVANSYDDVGGTISGFAGVNLGPTFGLPGLRGEIEIGYRENDVEEHTLGGVVFQNDLSFGSISTTSYLANLYYDFQTGSIFQPYIMAGGGIADVSFDNHGVTGLGTVLDDSETAYTYQVGAGFSLDLSNGLDLEVGYRYSSVVDVELTALDGTTSETDVDDHQILFGLKQRF